MLNPGPFKLSLLIFYIGNNKNPPITDEIYWSLDFRYCGVQLYMYFIFEEPEKKILREETVTVSVNDLELNPM